ncbi:MAG: Omp28-related outer membrane protein [Bacteroidia bacterium]|nr:Omp28-related outer membrane protein [Bacteroidia bacterium]
MKNVSKLILAAIMVVTAFTACKKEKTGGDDNGGSGSTAWYEPENKQRSLLMDFTATWCTYCGAWGHPTFDAAVTSLGDNAIPFSVQGGSSELAAIQYKANNDTPFYARHLNDLQASLKNVTVSGYPTLVVNNKSGYGPNSNATMVSDANNLNAMPAVANINFGVTKNANGFNIKSTVKFFQATTGDYHVTFFITQNNIDHRQNVSGTYVSPYNHNNIIRAFPISNKVESFGLNSTFGDAVISGDIASGKFVNVELNYVADNKSTMMPSGWNIFTWNQSNTANLYLTGIVWKKDSSGKFVFVNAVRKPL